MKPNIALLLLLLAGHISACSAQNVAIRSDGTTAPTSVATSPLLLGNKDGRVQLAFYRSANARHAAGDITLRAFDEILLGIAGDGASPGKTQPLITLWLDGRAVEMSTTNTLKLLDRRSSNDWEFASIDLTPAFGQGVNQFRRHLLFVQPDLVVICDEVSLREPAAVQTGWWFSDEIVFDSIRDEWHLQLPKAGLTARTFGSPAGGWKPLESSVAVQVPAVTGLTCLRAGVAEKVPEYRQITLLVPHARDAKRSLAFKSLESDTAFGARIHRDGLPTLVAFRKSTTSGEADLTGLKFSAPVAVDVFRPKRK